MARTIIVNRSGGGGGASTDAQLTLTNQAYSGNLAGATNQKEANDLIDALIIGGGGGTIQNANLSIQAANEGTVAGNARGANAVDLQTKRSSATKVASGSYATAGGGRDNTASNSYSTVAGGYQNTASSSYSTVAGGGQNTASGAGSTVAGGGQNTASGSYSTVAGGYQNTAHIQGQSIIGGYNGVLYKYRFSSECTLQLTTTSATSNQIMYINGTNRITIPTNTVYKTTVEVAANDTTNNANASGYIEHGLLLNNAGTVTYTTIGTQQSADLGGGCGTITVSADNTNKALQVDVSPNSANTIVWQAKVELVEVQE